MEALTGRVCVFPRCLLLCCSSTFTCSCLLLNTLRRWFTSSFVPVTLRVHPATTRHQMSMFVALCYCQSEAKWHFFHHNITWVTEFPAEVQRHEHESDGRHQLVSGCQWMNGWMRWEYTLKGTENESMKLDSRHWKWWRIISLQFSGKRELLQAADGCV